jgi:ribonuclease HI/ADP-ribose pyrophosphatase YjhB (NUDIX family)
MRQKISVRALIKSNEKILLLRRASGTPQYIGQFELPGGKVEYGEDSVASVRREVGEEIGAEAGVVQLYKVVSWLDTVERDTQHIIVVYLVSLADYKTKLTLSSEHDKYVWYRLLDIQLNELNLLTKVVLDDELKDLATDKNQQSFGSNVDNITSESNVREVIVYTDGGSRGNPGPSASGFVVYDTKGELLFEGGKYLGITTNNQAEYQAVRSGLEKAHELNAQVVSSRLDSQLVANQLTGVYQVKNRELWPIHASILELTRKFKKVTFTHVRREFNKDADGMVNRILDQHQ